MISTTTTTVVSLATTIFAGSFAFIAAILFFSVLVQKEILSEAKAEKWQRFSQALNVLLIPLGLTFLAIAFNALLKVF